jgi:hypothetical protein
MGGRGGEIKADHLKITSVSFTSISFSLALLSAEFSR